LGKKVTQNLVLFKRFAYEIYSFCECTILTFKAAILCDYCNCTGVIEHNVKNCIKSSTVEAWRG